MKGKFRILYNGKYYRVQRKILFFWIYERDYSLITESFFKIIFADKGDAEYYISEKTNKEIIKREISKKYKVVK